MHPTAERRKKKRSLYSKWSENCSKMVNLLCEFRFFFCCCFRCCRCCFFFSLFLIQSWFWTKLPRQRIEFSQCWVLPLPLNERWENWRSCEEALGNCGGLAFLIFSNHSMCFISQAQNIVCAVDFFGFFCFFALRWTILINTVTMCYEIHRKAK